MWQFFQDALREATKSSYKISVGAVLVHRNKIVSRGYNVVYSTGRKNMDSLHAEVAAIKKADKNKHKGGTIIVGRRNRRGELALAKPCKYCEAYMKKMGIKKVWYSSDDGWMKMDL